MFPGRFSKVTIGPSQQQKQLFGSENCLPRIVNKLFVRKLSFQNRWMKNSIGKVGQQCRSLDIVESDKKIEVKAGRMVMGPSPVKQELPAIRKEDIRLHNKTEVKR